MYRDDPRSILVSLPDADAIHEFLSNSTGMQPEYLQLSSGQAELKYISVDLDGVNVLMAQNNSHAVWRDQMADTGLHFGWVSSSKLPVSVCGRELEADQAMVWMRGAQMEYVLHPNTETFEIGVEESLLRNLGWKISGVPLSRVPHEYLKQLNYTCTAIVRGGTSTHRSIRDLRGDVLTLLEKVLAPWLNEVANESDRIASEPSFYRVFRRADTTFSSFDSEINLRVEDLSRTLGVSRRTLFYAFRKSVGMTPRRYFEIRRLHLLRSKLRDGRKDCLTVTQAALETGFSDLGRLSRTYYNQFGEFPSETLRDT